MKTTKIKKLAAFVAILPILIVLSIYNRLPAEIPTHWNIDGTVTYGERFNLLIIACVGLLVTILYFFLPKIDPKKKNYVLFEKYYDYTILFINCFLFVVTLIIISESFNPNALNIDKIVPFMCGIFFIVLGNILPKFKENFFCGIKTPWTLSDPIVWNKTHRLSGILFVFGGIIISILSLILPSPQILYPIFLGIIIIMVCVPCFMSYKWYKELNK